MLRSYKTNLYVGEGENMLACLNNYRYRPGTTNVRVRQWLHSQAEAGLPVDMALAVDIKFTLDGSLVPVDLFDKDDRLAVESAALVVARNDGERSENKRRRRAY